MRSFCFACVAGVALVAGMPTGLASGSVAFESASAGAEDAAGDAVKTYVDGKVAPFLNGLTELKKELKAANEARAKWSPFTEDWKKWTPEDAEKNKESYSYGEYVWSSKKDKAFRSQHTDTAAAKALKDFQEKSGGAVAEMFATDAKGGNVCQSQNTSDWFQGDEAKFQNVDKKKDAFFDKPKRDDTTGLNVVQVSVPIWDGETFLGMVCVSVVSEKAGG